MFHTPRKNSILLTSLMSSIFLATYALKLKQIKEYCQVSIWDMNGFGYFAMHIVGRYDTTKHDSKFQLCLTPNHHYKDAREQFWKNYNSCKSFIKKKKQPIITTSISIGDIISMTSLLNKKPLLPFFETQYAPLNIDKIVYKTMAHGFNFIIYFWINSASIGTYNCYIIGRQVNTSILSIPSTLHQPSLDRPILVLYTVMRGRTMVNCARRHIFTCDFKSKYYVYQALMKVISGDKEIPVLQTNVQGDHFSRYIDNEYFRLIGVFQLQCSNDFLEHPQITLRCMVRNQAHIFTEKSISVYYYTDKPKIRVENVAGMAWAKDGTKASKILIKKEEVLLPYERQRLKENAIESGLHVTCTYYGFPPLITIIEIPKEHKDKIINVRNDTIKISPNYMSAEGDFVKFLCYCQWHQHYVYIYIVGKNSGDKGNTFKKLTSWVSNLLILIIPLTWYISKKIIDMGPDGNPNTQIQSRYSDSANSDDYF